MALAHKSQVRARELWQQSTDTSRREAGRASAHCRLPWPAPPHSSRLDSAPVTKSQILTVGTGVEGELGAGQVAPPQAVGQKDVSCPPSPGNIAGCLWAWQERRECASRWLLGVGWGTVGVAEGQLCPCRVFLEPLQS